MAISWGWRLQPEDLNASIVRVAKVLQWEEPLGQWVLVSDEGWRTYASASHVIQSMLPVVCIIHLDDCWQIAQLRGRPLLEGIRAEPRDTGRRVFSVVSVSEVKDALESLT
jgi:hypothetical protein